MLPEPVDRSAACAGLADGWARRTRNHAPVHAAAVAREEGPFYCAECHAEVILRRGAGRAGHFAHEAARFLSPGGEEGALHRSCKEEIHAALAAENPHGAWEIERTIPAHPARGIAQLRPDVSGRVAGMRLAIEVQASALPIPSILQRTETYAQRGVPVLWIVPVPAPPDADEIRPKQHERYFHTLYLGRAYYWWPGLGASVLPVHFGTATRPVAMAEWYRPGRGRVQVGGYEAAYRAVKTPFCGPRLRIGRDFGVVDRAPFIPENRRKAVPACRLWLDRLAPWW